MTSEKKESNQRKRKDKKTQDTKTAGLPKKKLKRSLGVGMGTSKEDQQSLWETEKKYRALIEQSLQGIVVIQDFRIIFANTAITEISGYTKKELLSFSPEQLKSIIYPEDHKLVWGRFRDRLAGKPVPPHHEYRIKRKDGTIAWIETFATRIEYEQKPAIQATLIDMTRRKLAEAALEETNKLLETLLDHTHMMVAYLDPQFNFVRVNQAYAEADKREPSFFPGKNHFHLYPNPENEEIFRRVVETGKPYFAHAKPFEYAEHPERGITYWDWSLKPIKGPANVVIGLVLTVVNVTDQTQADLQLQKTAYNLRERLKELDCLYGMSNLIEKSGISLTEMHQGIVDLIPSGWQYPEITCARIIMEDQIFKTNNFSQTIWKQSSDIIVYGDRVGTLEVCYLEEKPEMDEGPFVQEERNLINAIAERLGKVAERRQAEEAIKQSEKKYREFADALPQIVFETDVKGNLTFVNRNALEYYGYTKSDLNKGLNVFDMVVAKDREKVKSYVAKTLRGEKSASDEYIALRKDGSTFPVVAHSIPIIHQNRVTGLRGIVVDITELKETEQALQWELAVNRALAGLSSALITPSSSIEDIASIVLDAAKSLTQSEHGFVSSIDPKTGDQIAHTLTKMMGKQCLVRGEDRRIRFPRGPDGLYPALWGQALNSRQPFFTNSPGTHETYRGIPEGHLPINNYLAVPAVIGEELVGQVALANSPKDYADRDLEAIKRLAELYAMAIQRRHAEENIKQQKEFLNNVIESLTYPFYVIDANDYTIKMANLAAGPANLSETTTCHALTHRSKRPCEGREHPCPLEEVKRTKKLVIVEHIHYDKEGNRRNVDVYANPVFDNEGNVVQVIEYCLDTTERRRAEEALRESEEKFRNLAEQSPNMIFINRKGRIVYANQKCEEIMGYKREEFFSPDFDFLQLIVPEAHEVIKTSFSRHLKGEEVPPYEYTLIAKGGGKIEAILTTKLISYEGENAILGTVTDITERKQAEKEIQKLNESLKLQAEELAATNKELEAFSYSVSHDLRAPLRTIDGFSRALLEDYGDKLDEAGKDYLRRVRAGTQHMGQLIENLLNLSVVIRTQTTREETNLSELVCCIIAEFKKTQPQREVQLIVQEGVLVHGDPRLLREMLENLLNNAWKFTQNRSRAKIEFGSTVSEGERVYFVRDNGVGFDMNYKDKLFIPFQRLHSAAEFSGNGIGLAIASRIINRHRGRIWAEGAVEKGATFYFTLK